MPNEVRARAVFDRRDMSTGIGQLKREFNDLSASKGAQAILQGVGLGAGLSAVNLLSTGVAKFSDIVSDAIADASDLNETVAKSEQIFGTNARRIDEWGDTAAEKFGQSKRAALDAASGFAGLFQTVGVELDQATAMSQKLTELGSDLASFYNTSVADALAALKSGLNGEAEPLRRFNVFLSDNAVKAKAAEMGLRGVGGTLTEQQKQLARYQIILDQTGKAQGDFERTSDGLANTQRSLSAELEDLSAEIGQQLLPIALALARAFRDEVLPAIREITKAIEDATKPGGPLATLGDIWSDLNRDFEDGRPAEKAKTGIGELDDALTKFAHDLVTTFTAHDEWQAVQDSSARAVRDTSQAVTDAGITWAEYERQMAGAIAAALGTQQAAADTVDPLHDARDAIRDAGNAAATSGPSIAGLRKQADLLTDSMSDARDATLAALDAFLETAYGPTELRLKLNLANDDLRTHLAELRKLEKIKHPTAEQRRDIDETRLAIIEDRKEVLRLQTRLGLLNGVSMAPVVEKVGSIEDALKRGSKAAQAFYSWLHLVGAAAAAADESGAMSGTPGYKGGNAAGGPAGPGYSMVGEGHGMRAEGLYLSPGSRAWVTPGQQGGSRGEDTHTHHTHVYLDGREIAEVVDRRSYWDLRRAPGAGPE